MRTRNGSTEGKTKNTEGNEKMGVKKPEEAKNPEESEEIEEIENGSDTELVKLTDAAQRKKRKADESEDVEDEGEVEGGVEEGEDVEDEGEVEDEDNNEDDEDEDDDEEDEDESTPTHTLLAKKSRFAKISYSSDKIYASKSQVFKSRFELEFLRLQSRILTHLIE